MTTVRDIVTAAHRKLAVVARGEEMSDDDASAGLSTFNALMHGFKAQGADVSHVTQDLSDTFALPAEFEEGVTYLLAQRLAPDFVVPAAFDVNMFWTAIQAAYATVPTLTAPAALLRPPSREDRENNLPSIVSS